MNKEKEYYKRIIKSLKKADNNIWETVLIIKNSKEYGLQETIMPLMNLRGTIIDFIMPLHKKFPELVSETEQKMDPKREQEINEAVDKIIKSIKREGNYSPRKNPTKKQDLT